jgi:hypothetical protein
MNIRQDKASCPGAIGNTKLAPAGLRFTLASCLFSAALLIPFSEVGADESAGAVAAPPETMMRSGGEAESAPALSEARQPEVGMSLQEALALVGSNPDSQEEVGAACGMLDVLTWHEDGTKIISVDGRVTSIVNGR